MKIKAYQVVPEYQESPLYLAAFFRHYGAACEAVEMARREK